MKEQISRPINNTSYTLIQNEMYPVHTKAMRLSLTREYSSSSRFTYSQENKYKIGTSSGKEITVETIYRHPKDQDPSTFSFDHLYLLAFNEQNQLIGHRESWFLYDYPNPVIIEGEIALKERGQGYAVPLELVHQMLLQKRADTTDKRVILAVNNQNKKRLSEFYKDPSISPQTLAELEAEQSRWQTIFTRVGMNELGAINFHPQSGTPYDRSKRKEVTLKRKQFIQEGRVREKATIEKTQELNSHKKIEDVISDLLAISV